MVLKLCGSRSRYKLVAVHLMYGLCIQISVWMLVIRRDLIL